MYIFNVLQCIQYVAQSNIQRSVKATRKKIKLSTFVKN